LSLAEQYKTKVQKALIHLEYSWKKIQKLPAVPNQLDEESLETWESFSARFARVVDLFLTKYLRARVLENDPGFEGSLRDFCDQSEKLGLIDSADFWMKLRELRNINAHDYRDDKLEEYFRDLLANAPQVLKVKDSLP
jgi:hypothetical protein